jgi:hypothetical protein
MKSFVIVLLSFLVGVLGLLLYLQISSLREQRRRTDELTARLDSLSKSASLSLQAECAKQALQQFNDSWASQQEAGFTNHYNRKLEKCFMRIQYWQTSNFVVQVFDAFESREYAEYMGSLTKPEWEAKPIVCRVILPSGEEQHCQSRAEFDDLVKLYMEATHF